MSYLLTTLGIVLLALSAFGDKDLRERYKNQLLWGGYGLVVVGLLIWQWNNGGCSVGWATHGSYEEC